MEGKGIRQICALKGMPAMSTVFKWLNDGHPKFSVHYTRAREIQAELYADEIVHIADTEPDANEAQWLHSTVQSHLSLSPQSGT
jgi:hypothetical protein